MLTARFLALALLVVAAACSDERDRDRPRQFGADEQAPESLALGPREGVLVPAGAPTVAFLGDSITAALHLAKGEGFPAELQRRLAAEGLPFELVDAGLSGDTTAGGLARLDWVLRAAPDVLVVELGGNDGLRGVSLASIESNLRAIAERARDAGARVLLLGVRLPPNYGADYAEGFAEIYERLAEELELDYVPFFMEGVGGVRSLNLSDGLHPTPAGHERLAENVLPALREVLDELQ